MKKYIVPPSKSINPVERYEDGKWVRIEYMDIKEGDILRVYNHKYEPHTVGRNGIVITKSNAMINNDGIYYFNCESDPEKIPNI